MGHLFGKDWQGNSAVRITASSPKRRHHWLGPGRDASWQNCHSKLGPSQRWDLVGQEAEIWHRNGVGAGLQIVKKEGTRLLYSFHSFSIFSVRRKKQAIYSKEQGGLASQQFEGGVWPPKMLPGSIHLQLCEAGTGFAHAM